MKNSTVAGGFSTNTDTNATNLNDAETPEVRDVVEGDGVEDPGAGNENAKVDGKTDPLDSVITPENRNALEKGYNFLWKCNFTKL